MKWLADEIRKRGLKPGIWLSPYEVVETAEIFINHKDWRTLSMNSVVLLWIKQGV